ncbi:MAG: neutral/alkaline non-lysosomal ceramidase N-terminal domain-containing protein, partial [Clostridia bacterium]|nr:neutral/alkaline non-lysosomal ceramidase N-terminal domain-containing protein [Clostridia bacterium]
MKTKQILAALLALLMLFATACGGGGKITLAETDETAETAGSETETAAAAPAGDTSGFCAGAGRADITPERTVPLAGYGNVESRMSNNVLDKLYATCVAVRDADGETLLLFNMDLINVRADLATQIRRLVNKATGVPEENILINSTHTHSGPAAESEDGGISQWKAKLYKAVQAAAKDAVADLDACTLSVGTTETDRLNFVRRYYKTAGFTTDNADYGSGDITAHETDADQEMRLIRFTRKNRPDIVLANWQCHPHRTGGAQKYDISSDIIGVWRKEAEQDGKLFFAFFQGGAGNINPTSRIPGETLYTDYKEIGKALCDHMLEGLKNMTETATGKVRAKTSILTGTYSHEGVEKAEVCKAIVAANSAGRKDEASALLAQNGISSAYEANAIIARAGRPETGEILLGCYAIGDIGIAAAPFEMFCQTEKQLREDSPFSFTFSCGYSNESQGYMPAAECFANKGYEVVISHYVQG